MKYIRLYEEFVQSQPDVIDKVELSDKTIDDVLSGEFFDDDESEELKSHKDYNDIYHIKNWKVY